MESEITDSKKASADAAQQVGFEKVYKGMWKSQLQEWHQKDVSNEYLTAKEKQMKQIGTKSGGGSSCEDSHNKGHMLGFEVDWQCHGCF